MTYCTSDIIVSYALDSLRWAISPVMNPAPDEQHPAVQRLRADTEKFWNQFNFGLSVSLRDYLFMASMGEAQYAPSKAKWQIVGLPTSGMHETAYKYCQRYAMSSWKNATKVFDHSWGGSYGGENWFDILNHAAAWQGHYKAGQLGKWIDWIADIEHNGKGSLFNKDTPPEVLNRDMSKGEITKFLDWKLACKNVARDIPGTVWCKYLRQPARLLVERYLRIWKGVETVQWAYPIIEHKLSAPILSPIQWGTEEIVVAPTSKLTAWSSSYSAKTETKQYHPKVLSAGVKLDESAVGGIPLSLQLVVGQLWMYAIVNDGKEAENG